jgi:hypothetical protein
MPRRVDVTLTGSGLVVEAVDPTAGEAAAPPAHRLRRAPEVRSDLLALGAFFRSQHDPAPQRQGLGALRSPRPALQHIALLVL